MDFIIMKHSFLVYIIFLWYVKRITIFLLISFGNFRNCSRGRHETFFYSDKEEVEKICRQYLKIITNQQIDKIKSEIRIVNVSGVNRLRNGHVAVRFYLVFWSGIFRKYTALATYNIEYFAFNAIINFHRRKNCSKNTTW